LCVTFFIFAPLSYFRTCAVVGREWSPYLSLMGDLGWYADAYGSIFYTYSIYHNFYYWFSVGEGTLLLHHLISDYAPADQPYYNRLPPLTLKH
jgi:hypothetical protein